MQQNFLNVLKNVTFAPVIAEELSETEICFFENHFNNIIIYTHISFQFSIPYSCCIKKLCARSFYVMRATRCASCNPDGIKYIQFPYLLDAMPCHWLICYRLFEINFQTQFYGAKYLLIFRPWVGDN